MSGLFRRLKGSVCLDGKKKQGLIKKSMKVKSSYVTPEMKVIQITASRNILILTGSPKPGGTEGVGGGYYD